jgi:hypothetical protein
MLLTLKSQDRKAKAKGETLITKNRMDDLVNDYLKHNTLTLKDVMGNRMMMYSQRCDYENIKPNEE